jgi:uncharacterized repeat protein (TIGR03843 family)
MSNRILSHLQQGEMEIVAQFSWGSNYTFLVNLSYQGETIEAVYKPQQGERPLWDFPAETLAGREVAAYIVSQALGWGLVPPTVFRAEAPLGPGSLQQRVAHDPELHYFTFDDKTRQRLRPAAIFDLVVNNADRKGGHILLSEGGKLLLIDHGICFHAEPKLRTVIWDFVGEPLPADLSADAARLQAELTQGKLRRDLAQHLAEEEIDAMYVRIAELLTAGRFPFPPEDQRYTPWPLV